MAISNLNELYIEQLRDLYNAEGQARGAYERWKTQASSDDLKQMFDRRMKRCETRRGRIEQICDDMGVDPSGEKCHGMEGLVREGNSFIDDTDEGPARDAGLVANAQRIEHYGIAGYGCARTYALHLDRDDAAQTIQQILDDDARIDEQLTELAESVLNREAVAA